MSDSLLELHNVTVYRGDTLALDDFSLNLSLGTQTAILGPNGAGKSTLLKLVTGEVHAVPRDETTVRLLGLARWSVWDIRAKLGLVSHDLHCDYAGDARVLEVMLSGFYSSIGVYPHQAFTEAQRDRAGEVANQVGVADLIERPYAALSTGEQRRCLLGRALVHRPQALILDEPTAGLDIRASFLYLDIVRRLIASGTTVILVTHHVHEIPPEVSRIILLNEGRVVADGPRNEILTRERMTRLYGTPIELVPLYDYVYLVPAP